jgi:hypothetical protein
VDTAQSDFTKQATPWYQLWVLAVWTYLLTRKINIAFRYTGSGKTLLWMTFR